ncbi:MAG: Ig-like domain-containing protein [Verrucomicrobiota bacterium]|jgi:plastocyanin
MKAIKNLIRLGFMGVGASFILSSIPAKGAVAKVSVVNDSFSPAESNIHVGDEVIWTWGNNSEDHNVVSTAAPFAWLFPSPSGSQGTTGNQNNSNLRDNPFSFTNTFNSTGTFPYECTEHAAIGMVGTINVTTPVVPPTVNITAPASGAEFSAPATLTIQASASDGSGVVTNVHFLVDSTVLTGTEAAPFVATANNLAAGNYTLTAIASANDGLTVTNSITVSVVTPTPVVTGTPAFDAPGNFQFSYSATIGLTYVVQASTNLLDWTALATNTATASPEIFTDTNAGNNAAFYRVEQLPNP